MSTPAPGGNGTGPVTARLPAPTDRLVVTASALTELVRKGAEQWDAPPELAAALAGDVGRGLLRMHAREAEARAVTRRISDVEPQAVRWLWHHRIPRGMLAEVCGDPGEGKSHLTLALASALTIGAPLPGDLPGTRRKPADVLLVAPEDSPETTIRPRLEAMGADLSHVSILDGFRDPDKAEPEPLDLSRADHRLYLRDLVEDLGAELVVIDPITAHLGGVNEWKDSEVRSILAPLARLADETGAAILLVRHLRKGGADRAIYRAGGSIAFTASVRSSLLVGRPDGEERRRAVVRVKGNLSPEPAAVGFVLDEGGWGWTEAGEWTAADLLRGDASPEDRNARQEASEWLREALADGPRRARDVQKEARAEGIADRTLRRARTDLGVVSSREGGAGSAGWWVWALPPEDLATLGVGHDSGPLSESPTPAKDSDPPDPPKVANPPYMDTLATLAPSTTCAKGCGASVGRPGMTCAECQYEPRTAEERDR